VKALEKKEREWIEKLRNAQTVQESAFEQLEDALIRDHGATASTDGRKQSNLKAMRSSGSPHSEGGDDYERGMSSSQNSQRDQDDYEHNEKGAFDSFSSMDIANPATRESDSLPPVIVKKKLLTKKKSSGH
jgi:hypothetical protein